jgi:hypothetical protein
MIMSLAWIRVLGKAQMLFSAPATNTENNQAVWQERRNGASDIIMAGRTK